jgi:hypothetical protein
MSRCLFNDRKYDAWLSRVEYKLDAMKLELDLLVRLLTKEGNQLMALADDVTKLTADLSTLTTAVTNAVSAIQAQTAQITALKAQLAAAGVDPAVLAQLETAISGIESQTTALTGATPGP